jgi:ATP-dependent protease ClpP protease subunit
MRDIIARTTGRTDEEIDNDLRRGRVLSAEEALEYALLNRLL